MSFVYLLVGLTLHYKGLAVWLVGVLRSRWRGFSNPGQFRKRIPFQPVMNYDSDDAFQLKIIAKSVL